MYNIYIYMPKFNLSPSYFYKHLLLIRAYFMNIASAICYLPFLSNRLKLKSTKFNAV